MPKSMIGGKNMADLRERYGGYRLVSEGPLHAVYKHKVLPDVMLVATDRAQDYDMNTVIEAPDKSRLFTEISVFWHKKFNKWGRPLGLHTAFLQKADDQHAPQRWGDRHVPESVHHPDLLGRSVIMQRLEMLPFRLVVFGYLCGYVLRCYEDGCRKFGMVMLPDGLAANDKLPRPIVAAVEQSSDGKWDIYSYLDATSPAHFYRQAGPELRATADSLVSLYRRAHHYARERGIIIAEARFDVGRRRVVGRDYSGSELVLGGSILTPDVTRSWLRSEPKLWQRYDSLTLGSIQMHVQNMRKVYGEAAQHEGWEDIPIDVPDESVHDVIMRYHWVLDVLKGEPRNFNWQD